MEKNKKDNQEYLRKYAPEYVIGQETSRLVDLLSGITDKLQGIDFEAIENLQGEQGLPGEKGQNPVKGTDYFTEDEIGEIAETIKEFVTDGADGLTPIKGTDYFTESDIKEIQKGILTLTAPQVVDFINTGTAKIKSSSILDLDVSFEAKLETLNDPSKSNFQLDYGRIKNAPQTFYNPNDPSQPYYQVSASGGSGSASTAGIPEWTANTAYTSNRSVWQTDRLLSRIAAGTSEATFSPLEAITWNFIGQSYFPTWTATTFFYGGEHVLLNGALYQANANFTTSATLNTAELVSWTRVTPTKVLNITGTTTLTEANLTALNDSTGASYTLTLPTAVGRDGQLLEIKKTDSSTNTITVDGSGTETIDGSLTFVIGAQYAGIIIRSDGANWQILNAFYPTALFITVTGTTTLTGNTQSVRATNAGTSYTITLPTPSTLNAFNSVSITKTDATTNQIVIVGALIPFSLNTQGDSVIVRSDGTSWIGLADISAQGAAGSTAVTNWAAATNYETNQFVINNGTLYQRIAAGTSLATFLLDAGTWLMVQNYQNIATWSANTYHEAGKLVLQGTRTLSRTASGVSSATFTNTEAANYTLVSNDTISAWLGLNYYYAGEKATINQKTVQRIASGITTGTFTAAESLNWTLITYTPSTWLATTYYYTNEVVYAPNTQDLILGLGGFTSTAFNTAEVASGGWVIKTLSGNAKAFTGSTYYFAGDLILDSGTTYRRSIAGTSGTFGFTVAEKVNWAMPNGFAANSIVNAAYTVVETDDLILLPAGATFIITIPASRVNPIIKFATSSLSATPPTIATSGTETITSPSTYAQVTSFVQPGTTGLGSSVQFQKVGLTWLFIA